MSHMRRKGNESHGTQEAKTIGSPKTTRIARLTLLVRADPRQSMTALDVKFSLAMSSKLDHCLVCESKHDPVRVGGEQ